MSNPLRILQTLDCHPAAGAEITIFGRAALALGYPASPAAFAATHDVDAILPLVWLGAAGENLDFWEAQQQTNAELEPDGLYLTHLFRESEVILTTLELWVERRGRAPESPGCGARGHGRTRRAASAYFPCNCLHPGRAAVSSRPRWHCGPRPATGDEQEPRRARFSDS